MVEARPNQHLHHCGRTFVLSNLTIPIYLLQTRHGRVGDTWLIAFSEEGGGINHTKQRTPKLTSPGAGALRQQPPHRIAKRRLRRPLHLHGRRGRRPQDLLHPELGQRQDGLVEHGQPQRRHQADLGHDHWRVERH